MKIARINEILDAEGAPSAGKLHWFESIGSTNDFILNEVAEFHAVVCLAGEQTAGRGRRGRHWVSSPGQGIYLSMGWDIRGGSPAGLSLVCGLSLLAALTGMGVSGLKLKWPNDVLLGQGKLAGILVEISGGRCVIGIGLNVKISDTPATEPGAGVGGVVLPATGLAENGYHIDAELLTAALILHLNRDLDLFGREGFGPFMNDWNGVHAYQGAMVELTGARSVFGRVVGVDAEGALCLQTDHGHQRFHGGEVSLRPPPSHEA